MKTGIFGNRYILSFLLFLIFIWCVPLKAQDNNPPVAEADTFEVIRNRTLDIPAPGVLENDSDPDGDDLTAEAVDPPTRSSNFNLATDGSITYTHDGSASVSDSFTYWAHDLETSGNTVTVLLNILDVLDGGVVAGDQVICHNTDVAPFASSIPATGGSESFTYTWQFSTTSSTPGSGTWTNIDDSDSETWDMGLLTETTWFVRRATDPVYGNAYSNVITVVVYLPLTGGTVTGDQALCGEGDPAAFSSTMAAAGGSGSYTYTWQYSTTNSTPGLGTWNNIPSSNSLTWDYGTLTETTYFVRRAMDPICGTVYSNVLIVTFNPQFTGGTVTGDQILCYNGDPEAFLSTSAATGGSGTFTYTWQYSTTSSTAGSGIWTDISGSGNETWDAGQLTETSWFVRKAVDPVCGTVYSNVLTVEIYPLFTGGSVAGEQTFCGNGDPVAFTSTEGAGGGSGTFTYTWQYSTTSSTAGSGIWTDISGSGTGSWDVGQLTETTWFVRKAEDPVCGTVYSNVLTVEVHPSFTGGTVTGDQTLCYNGDPEAFLSTSAAIGGSGTFTYTWQYSTTSLEPGLGTWNDIPSSDNPELDYGTLTQMTYFVRKATDAACGSVFSNVLTVTVNPMITGGTVAVDQLLCYNGDAAPFTSVVTAAGGSGTLLYTWQFSTTSSTAGSGTWTDINDSNSETWDAGQLTETTWFVRKASDALCHAYSNIINVNVYPPLKGGTITGSQTICSNSDVPAFSSTEAAGGGSGTAIYTWQYSTTSSTPGSGSWSDISGSNSLTWDHGTLTQTTYFVRRAIDPVCGTVYSNVITVTVSPQLTGGTIGSNQTICYNGDVAAFTSPAPATGGSGNITYTWQYSTTSSTPGSGNWSNIPSSNALTWDYGTLTQTTYFVRRAVDPVCGTVYSNVITVTVHPQFTGGTIASNQTICYNGDVAAFTSPAPATGGSGAITYAWQYSTTSSTPGSGSWSNIAASNSLTYDHGTLTQTTYFVRRAVDPVCGTVYSNVITVTVHPQFTGGTIASNQTICYNSDVAAFTSPVPATGGSSAITYTWQYSTTSSTPGLGTWNNVPSSNSLTWDHGALTETTYFVRRAVDPICGTVYSNVITVTVSPQFTGGIIGDNQTICYNANVAAFTSPVPAAGGSGTITYTWQYSTTSSTPGIGTWNDISSSNTQTWDYGTLTQTTYFVRKAVNPVCGTVYSNVISVTVHPQLTGGTIASNQAICYNSDVTAFISPAPAGGGSGTITYTWQYSTTSSTPGSGVWTDITPSNSPTWDYGTLTQTTYFVRRAVDPVCGTAWSNVITVTVHPQLTGGNVASDQTICYNSDVTAFTSPAPAGGGSGTITYTWQYSTTSSTPGSGSWTNIAASNAQTLDYGTLTQTTYFVRRTVDPVCGTVYSNVITITVRPQLTGGTIASDQTICYNGDVAAFTSEAPAGGGSGTQTYTWQYSTTSSTPGTGSWINIPASNAPIWDFGPLTQTTYFVRRAIDPICGTVWSNVITVTVRPQLTGGTIAANQSILYGQDPVAFTSVAPANGGSSTVTYGWQYSVTSSTAGIGVWTDIPNSDVLAWNAGILFQTTYFVRRVVDPVCGTVYSNVLTVLVNAPPVAADDNNYSVAEEGNLAVPAPGVLSNDTDPEGDGLTAILIDNTDHQAAFAFHANGSFSYTHDGSETTIDSFTYRVLDRHLQSDTATVRITILPVNDLPVLAGIETEPILYNQGDKDVPVTATLTVSDVDNETLQSATIRIIGYNPEEDRLFISNHPGLVKDWNDATGTLTLEGTRSLLTYENAFRNIEYENINGTDPSGDLRIISFVVNDGFADSQEMTREIRFNRTPVLSNLEITTIIYCRNTGPLPFTATLAVNDPDDQLLSGAIVQIGAGYARGQDILSFTPAGGIRGIFDPVTGMLTMSGRASGSDYQIALRSVRFMNMDPVNPVPGIRTITMVVTDGKKPGNVVSRNLNITVPTASVSGSVTICEHTTAAITVNLTGSSPWKFSYQTGDGPVTEVLNVNTSIRSLFVKNAGIYTLTQVTDKNNCTGLVSGNASVQVLPAPKVTIEGLEPAYNATTLRVPVAGEPRLGNFIPMPSLIMDNDTMYFYPLVAGVGTHTIIYRYLSPQNYCYGYDTAVVRVLEATADIVFADDRTLFCDNDKPFLIRGINTTGNVGSFGIEGNRGLTDHHNNTATVDPSQLELGIYDISYTYYDGTHLSITEQLTLGRRPKADFTWENACFEESRAIGFNDRSLANEGIITEYKWYFYNGSGYDSLMTSDVSYIFNQPGNYRIGLQVETSNGCTGTTQKIFGLRPTVRIAGQTYFEDFEDRPVAWRSESSAQGNTNNWTLGTPVKGFNGAASGDVSWFTYIPTANAPLEQSWVTSPCFDLTGTQKPMIRMDIWRLFNTTRDGATLQATADSGKTWQNIGELHDGINWFNEYNILGTPGNQTIGWSNIRDIDWLEARHSLDMLRDRTRVQFRIAYGSDGTARNTDGIAFDNVWIGERNKTSVIEHFTNADDLLSRDANEVLRNFMIENSEHVIDLQYHTSFPGPDPFNADNPYTPGARMLYYGLTDVPYSVLDGGSESLHRFDYDLRPLDGKAILVRNLVDSKFWINLFSSLMGDRLHVEAEVVALQEIPTSELTVHILAVERHVSETEGGNGETDFYSVVKTMMPDAGGTTLYKSWQKGEYQFIAHAWDLEHVYDRNELRVVAFIQDEQSREIFQAAMDSVSLKTALEEVPGVSDPGRTGFFIYPDPASTVAYIRFSEALEQDTRLEIFSSTGSLVSTDLLMKGDLLGEIPAAGLPDGLYMVRLTAENRLMGTGKLTIRH